VRASLASNASDAERAESFADTELARLSVGLTPDQVRHIDRDSILSSWYGFARYWRKKSGAGA
jgi:hypothetical protein